MTGIDANPNGNEQDSLKGLENPFARNPTIFFERKHHHEL